MTAAATSSRRHERSIVDGFLDKEQPRLLRTLRRCSLDSDHLRWESLRGQLIDLGYNVVVVRGVEHLRPLAG